MNDKERQMHETALPYLGGNYKCVAWNMGECTDETCNGCEMYRIEYTQEQLQDKVLTYTRWNTFLLLYSFDNWRIKSRGMLTDETNITELWLRYTMWAIHGKTWSEEKGDWR